MNGLFPPERLVGVFKSFSDGGLEFQADLVLPYKSKFQESPMHGQFLLVQLTTAAEAVLGRITMVESRGRLNTEGGDEYALRFMRDADGIPEDVREQHLKYRTNMKVLGVLKETEEGQLVFVPSHRRLPHYGSKVAFLSDELLKFIAGHGGPGAELGFLGYGEFVYAGNDKRLKKHPELNVLTPAVLPRFEVKHLVSRRSFIFARAGFGKSNLVKLLFSHLYAETPVVEKRQGRQVPVGTLIFDPDGEYYWPDDKNRPGLCDVPALEDKLVVFTDKEPPSDFYGSFVLGGIKLDIRALYPSVVLPNALAPEKLEQQNVQKLMQMGLARWAALVDLIERDGHVADLDRIKRLMHLEDGQDAEMLAARANMTRVVRMLHDPKDLHKPKRKNTVLDDLRMALQLGRICVMDISRMRGHQGLALSGLILQHIFNHNQEEFTKREAATIPTIAVLEEAQSVLQDKGATESPYVSWVKEGRKYDLGAMLITQQPGSIPRELLSQGDNWFVFHLLSEGDLHAVKQANAHFSKDLLSSLLNEPIVGQGIFWSSAGHNPYPLSVRVLSFEDAYKVRDPKYRGSTVDTFAQLKPMRHRAALAFRDEGLDSRIKKGEPVLWTEAKKVLWDSTAGEMPGLSQRDRDQLVHRFLIQILNAWFGSGKWQLDGEKGQKHIALKAAPASNKPADPPA